LNPTFDSKGALAQVVDLTLTDEQKDLRDLAHSFAEKDIRKVAWEYDKEGTWAAGHLEKAWEVGLMNTHVPEEYGGRASTTSPA